MTERMPKALAAFIMSLVTLMSPGAGTAVSTDYLKTHVRAMSSEAMDGRLAGSRGGAKAERYVGSEFRKLGLGTFPSLEEYYQPFSFTSDVSLEKGNSLVFYAAGGEKVKLEAGRDFIPASFSEDLELKAGEVVFAGYGIRSRDPERDDYKDLEVKGKIVVVLRDGPDGDDPKSPYAPYHSSRYKASVARELGARALILVSATDKGDELPAMRTGAVAGSSSIAVLSMKREFLAKLFAMESKQFPSQEQLKDNLSFPFRGVTAEARVVLKREKATARNVVGLLKATSPSDEYVIVGAHWDHLGRGIEGSLSGKWGEVHPGADDNASGVAGMLELARVLSLERTRKRNVVFIAFAAEELGGLGSVHFTKNCPVDIGSVAAMVNLDMIGRLKEKLIIDGTGTAEEWKAVIERANGGALTVSQHEDGYGASDHSSFYAKGIPVLFFFTGAHGDYHLPSDTFDKINYEGEAKILELVRKVVLETVSMEKRPAYKQTEGNSGGRASFKVYVGTVPDFTEEGKGFKVLSVRPGSPAEKAGIKAGDLLVSLAGRKIENIYDYTYILQEHKPGEEAEAVIVRDGSEVKLKLVFGSRKASE